MWTHSYHRQGNGSHNKYLYARFDHNITQLLLKSNQKLHEAFQKHEENYLVRIAMKFDMLTVKHSNLVSSIEKISISFASVGPSTSAFFSPTKA